MGRPLATLITWSSQVVVMSGCLPLTRRTDDLIRHDNQDALVLEGWAQGYMVGTLVFMAAITVANMRRRVLLHKLILAELILGMGHGTWLFVHKPVYGWYLSVTAVSLNISWSLHNVIAWMKNRPFLSKGMSRFYIGTVILAQPYWMLEIYANFTYFNQINELFEKTRPLESLFRDPWWIYTTCNLFWVIKSQYDFTLMELVRQSPRFGVMLVAMCLSIIFVIVDFLSVTHVFHNALPTGINPFWKVSLQHSPPRSMYANGVKKKAITNPISIRQLSFVFKCLCDIVILDDFKTALDRLRDYLLIKNGTVEQLVYPHQRLTPRTESPRGRYRSARSPSAIRQPEAVAGGERRLSYSSQHVRKCSCSESGNEAHFLEVV
ncbi:hypothetical protein PAAG_06920 [Paracoccidioides lutzii Pb01]|uniref:Uncharacterized protein n=1 Tax=Paracoccidioides lutzii (strain ATCC MYA-826 / Pb01) TaxID=502779 RepID=C1H8C4_PARBA|nr:hypothetical protein PAAG_06920 [Paracoccidioides lutzii Pb01]EEH36502.2 hypothetical protein PAAG_06920 [Paracoccidioides lutzii Pb01]